MPVFYSGIQEEHHAVRQAAGIFDISHMGEFLVTGPRALDLVQYITTNDAAKLLPGKAQYSCMTNESGGIVDDLLVYCLAPDRYMLVVNAANIDKDWLWLVSHNRVGAELENISADIALLAVQGPKATMILQKLSPIDLAAVPYYNFTMGSFAGIDNVILSNTGYTGAGGFELYLPASSAVNAWHAVMEAGREIGIKPAGLGARDTLRLEKGYCLYGNDIDDTTTPIEAGLGWITKFSKPFIGREILEKQKSEGVSRKLVGFELVERGIPRHGYSILDHGGKTAGKVTSGSISPTLHKAIGLGYVRAELAVPGNEIFIQLRQATAKAVIAKLPFV